MRKRVLIISALAIIIIIAGYIGIRSTQKPAWDATASAQLCENVAGHATNFRNIDAKRVEFISVEESLGEIGMARCVVAVYADGGHWTPMVAYTMLPCSLQCGDRILGLVEIEDAMVPATGDKQNMLFFRQAFAGDLASR